jgi:hypothetical protein
MVGPGFGCRHNFDNDVRLRQFCQISRDDTCESDLER